MVLAGTEQGFLSLVERAISAERSHPSGIINLILEAVYFLAFSAVLLHEAIFLVVETAARVLAAAFNFAGRFYAARNPFFSWDDVVFIDPRPARASLGKALLVGAFFVLACPITIIVHG